jgi:hypothetical protein
MEPLLEKKGSHGYKGSDDRGRQASGGPLEKPEGSRVDFNKVHNADLEARIRALNSLEIDAEYVKAQEKVKEKDLQTLSAGFIPMVIVSIKTIVLPRQLFNTFEDAGYAFVALAKALGYNIKLYEQEDFRLGELSEFSKQFLRGIYHGLISDKKIAIRAKDSPFESGRTLVRCAQVVGYFSAHGKDDLLVRNHRFFANNPKETRGDTTVVRPLKENLLQCFMEKHDVYANVLYSLLKKSYVTLSKETQDEIRLAYTMDYGTYVNLHFSQSRRVAAPKKRGIQMVTKVPQKPSLSTCLTRGELNLLVEIHQGCFDDHGFTNQKTWATMIWSARDETHLEALRDRMADRNRFLAQFGSLTTARLNLVRNQLKNSSKTKASVTQQELCSALEARNDILDGFVSDLHSFKTQEMSKFINQCLGLESDEVRVGLSTKQRQIIGSVILPKLARDDPYKTIAALRDIGEATAQKPSSSGAKDKNELAENSIGKGQKPEPNRGKK